ncbi:MULTISPECIES: fluoride efflux transporter CrcB [unclassified Caulobacter]|uniref:fluoride efflux transporter CrcB n=1 Tax=unclassified Caulobacter TaxID=2648921 RepID=UPI000D3BC2A1|nr:MULTISPECIES: fluoride efflux transporter CrcB [unclassified Caulobacter]PTS84532.1 fluoride efflux transporter CrcB [Caulobacter sp. HMWF009]PTT08753.1 fluoride efflux transporter CrcB [Caulobacter sp. HMWF025]PTT79824.1 fluoride efflux transporter CrcB [Pseudomonas sp. HMWF010]
MNRLLLVAAGGAVGSVARYVVGVQTLRLFGSAWPYGTLTVNVAGGFLMGILAAWLAQSATANPEPWRVLLGVGVMGGFTTFSAFTLETALMIEKRAYAQAFTYTAASVLLALAALFAGMLFARRIFVA